MHHFYVKINASGLCLKIFAHNAETLNLLKDKVLSIPSARVYDGDIENDFDVRIMEDHLEIGTPHENLRWNGCLSSDDAFVFVNALAYHTFYQKSLIGMHANAVINEDGAVILIIGDFGAGKSTFCRVCEENGYKICAGDQIVMDVVDGKLYFIAGSVVDKIDDAKRILDYNLCNQRRPVAKIILLNGVCDKGRLNKRKMSDIQTISKRISNYLFWPFYTPVLSVDEGSFIRLYSGEPSAYQKVFKAIKELQLYRGDKIKIFEDLKNGG